MSKKQKRIFWPVIVTALLSLGLLAFVAARPRAGGSKTGVDSPPPSVVGKDGGISDSARVDPPKAVDSTPPRVHPIAPFESELVTITPHGFEPKEITRPKGLFLL